MTTNEEMKNYLLGALVGLEYHKPAADDCSSTANEYWGAYKMLTNLIRHLPEQQEKI